MQNDEQKKLIEQYCNAEITGKQFCDAVEALASASNNGKPNVICCCYLCNKELVDEKDKLDMHGEVVCSQCWDDNMYMALQDSGGF